MKDDTTPATKGDLAQLRDELDRKIESFKDEILRHFDVAVENIRHDLTGALRDAIEIAKDLKDNHERRIRRLERAAGLVAVD